MNFEYIEITDISQLNVYIDDILKNIFDESCALM